MDEATNGLNTIDPLRLSRDWALSRAQVLPKMVVCRVPEHAGVIDKGRL